MEATILGPGRVREVEGNVPLAAVVWLEQHPTAAVASALSVSAPGVRWHYRISPTVEVILRGTRVEVMDHRSGGRVGSARIHGIRSAADFDRLPRAVEPPPFTPPEPSYPAVCGFACDLDGRVARFYPAEGAGGTGPGLVPRFTSYPNAEPRMDEMVAAMAHGHERPAHPISAFATRVRELVSVMALPSVVGTARVYSWFEDDRVLLWPLAQSDLISLTVSALHARKACLGCSRHDPRDRLASGTYSYARGSHSRLESFVREDTPADPLDVAGAAALLGRSSAELGATQLNVRFAGAMRVDPTQLRRAH